jgi:hypothetical protein
VISNYFVYILSPNPCDDITQMTLKTKNVIGKLTGSDMSVDNMTHCQFNLMEFVNILFICVKKCNLFSISCKNQCSSQTLFHPLNFMYSLGDFDVKIFVLLNKKLEFL